MNRRQFVRALSTAGVAAAVSAGATAAMAEETVATAIALGDANVNFTQEVDVLICGGGISGMMCALEPALAGFKTLIVEQNGFLGGDSIYSAGSQMCDCAEITKEFRPQKYSSIDQVRERFAPYYEDDPEGLDKLMTWREWGGKWMDKMHYEWGYEFQETVEGPYQQAFFPKNGICAMVDEFVLMEEKLLEAGVEVLYETELQTLIADETGAIVGARFASVKTGEIVDIAAKVTVISCGGYASNQEWMTKYAPDTADVACIVSGRTGVGIKAGLAAGGTLAGMASPGNLNPRHEAGHMLGMFNPVIALLPNGKRFYSETAVHDAATGCLKNGYFQWWSIWDNVAQNGRNQEVIKHASAFIKTANSLEELAEGMGMHIETLKAAFDRYDGFCAAGVDEDFGRTLFLQPLEPPYYYLLNFPVRYKSSGGLNCARDGEVLNAAGEPIPGLWATGCSAGTTDIVPAAGSGLLTGTAIAAFLA